MWRQSQRSSRECCHVAVISFGCCLGIVICKLLVEQEHFISMPWSLTVAPTPSVSRALTERRRIHRCDARKSHKELYSMSGLKGDSSFASLYPLDLSLASRLNSFGDVSVPYSWPSEAEIVWYTRCHPPVYRVRSTPSVSFGSERWTSSVS